MTNRKWNFNLSIFKIFWPFHRLRSNISLSIFSVLVFISFSAEFWANSKPLVMNVSGQLYFPVLKDYHPSEFGMEKYTVTDYRELAKSSIASWTVWPIVRWDPYESNEDLMSFPSSPDAVNWLGTDDRGRDVLTRLLYGFRYSFGYGMLVWLFSFILGILSGSLMGFCGGVIDLFGQRIVEIFESIPLFYVLLFISGTMGAGLGILVVVTSFFFWMNISNHIRIEVHRLKQLEFVEGARAIGMSDLKILLRHILPNAMASVITLAPFAIAVQVSFLTSMDYLGFGLNPPTPSWGELLRQSRDHFSHAWWLATYTSLALFSSLLILHFIGEGMRDLLDYRFKRKLL